jgi:hypothetical protein
MLKTSLIFKGFETKVSNNLRRRPGIFLRLPAEHRPASQVLPYFLSVESNLLWFIAVGKHFFSWQEFYFC